MQNQFTSICFESKKFLNKDLEPLSFAILPTKEISYLWLSVLTLNSSKTSTGRGKKCAFTPDCLYLKEET